jgi:hypothetical protein
MHGYYLPTSSQAIFAFAFIFLGKLVCTHAESMVSCRMRMRMQMQNAELNIYANTPDPCFLPIPIPILTLFRRSSVHAPLISCNPNMMSSMVM